ncbi:hypothetical protein QOZ80_6AG0509010 [Eleusine coracana subsp. coracana]|nr:hypothetical protein QOZ80_6AG0509010 [Eleusine coracana subsp. coracana]
MYMRGFGDVSHSAGVINHVHRLRDPAKPEPRGGGRLEHGLRVGLDDLRQPWPQLGRHHPRPVLPRAARHHHRRGPEPPRPDPRHHQPRPPEPEIPVHLERHERRHHQRWASSSHAHHLRPLAAFPVHPFPLLHPVHQLLEPLGTEHLRDRRARHRRHVGQRGRRDGLHNGLPRRVRDHVAEVAPHDVRVEPGRVEPAPAVDEPRHAATRVGRAHRRGEELPHVRGEGLEPRGAARRGAGRGAEAVHVGRRDHVVAAHEGGSQQRVRESRRVVPRELGVEGRAVPWRVARAEEVGPLTVGPRGQPAAAARADQQLGPRVGQRGEPVPVDEEVVRPPRQREPAAREPHQLQRQREATRERQRHAGDRAVGVGQVHVRERGRAGVGYHQLGARVGAGDLG